VCVEVSRRAAGLTTPFERGTTGRFFHILLLR
jgi:hypothetical protein